MSVLLYTKLSLRHPRSRRSEHGGKGRKCDVFFLTQFYGYISRIRYEVIWGKKYGAFAKFHRLLTIPSFSFLANASIWIVGSEPMDRKHIRGVRESLSSQVFSRFKITGSVYLSSKESAIYFLAWKTVRSGHQDLEMNIRGKNWVCLCFILSNSKHVKNLLH